MAKTELKAKAASATTEKTKAGKAVESKGAKEAPKPAKKVIAKAAAKPAPKAAAAAKPAAKTAKAPSKTAKAKPAKAGKGDRLYCELCGLVVSVDEACGCVEVCDIVCCGQEMQLRK
jgi:biotin carboxyl carrier protein